MHKGLCFTLVDVIKPAYWALVHSGRSPARWRASLRLPKLVAKSELPGKHLSGEPMARSRGRSVDPPSGLR